MRPEVKIIQHGVQGIKCPDCGSRSLNGTPMVDRKTLKCDIIKGDTHSYRTIIKLECAECFCAFEMTTPWRENK